MASSIALILSKTGGPPFRGSVGYVNDAIAPILSRNQWRVQVFQPPSPTQGQEGMLPLALTGRLAALDGVTPLDVALFDAAGTAIRAPTRGWARRNVMLYHGLAYGYGTWMSSSDIDLHCANSPYLERSLRAFFAFPNWRARRCLNPQGMRTLTNLPLPVPCVEHPDGHPGFGYGSDLPVHVQRALDSNVIWGHALQVAKQDWFATLAILYWLNSLRGGPAKPRIALFIPEGSLGRELRATLDAMLPPGQTCNDFFLEVPLLNQRALFRLMRASRFGLAYNEFPEPFGFYVLESIHNGCPVYTNGAGNNRFLLPPSHGIHVQETFAMAPGHGGERDPAAYRPIAERILADLDGPELRAEECRRGAALIREQWSLAAFERALSSALAGLDRPLPPEPEFEDLQVQLSPLVRSLDPVSGRCL
ncbi:MAG TPA: hypothetical protein VJ484_04945, partial [Lysobacter sp.]|nr:hypothetical protein [Lysobacter sp.]